jgi:hypothetical protein
MLDFVLDLVPAWIFVESKVKKNRSHPTTLLLLRNGGFTLASASKRCTFFIRDYSTKPYKRDTQLNLKPPTEQHRGIEKRTHTVINWQREPLPWLRWVVPRLPHPSSSES